MSEGTFLSEDEVGQLTGVKTGRKVNGVSVRREQLQANWLRSTGIPFYINARGRPIIVRANLTGRPSGSELKAPWQPRAIRAA